MLIYEYIRVQYCTLVQYINRIVICSTPDSRFSKSEESVCLSKEK